MPLYWEGLSALFQRTAAGGDQGVPAPTFDAVHFVEGRRAGSVIANVVDAQAAGGRFGTFTVPREGIYQVLAHLAIRAGNVITWNLVHESEGGADLWAVRFVSTSAGFRFEKIMYLRRGDVLVWINEEAHALGDTTIMSIANWEIVQA